MEEHRKNQHHRFSHYISLGDEHGHDPAHILHPLTKLHLDSQIDYKPLRTLEPPLVRTAAKVALPK